MDVNLKCVISFQYKNTFTEDLWAALEEASNKPVGAVMSTWTKQMGFPVVEASPFQFSSFIFIIITLWCKFNIELG